MNDAMMARRGRRRWRPTAFLGALIALVVLGSGSALAAASYHRAQRDVVEFGNNVEIPADETVSGDVVVFGGNVDIHGTVEGSAVVFGGDLHIYPEGSVQKDTVSFGGSIINESRTTPHTPRKSHVIPMPTTAPEPQSPEMPVVPSMPEVPEPPSHAWHFGAVWASIVVPDLLLTLLVFFLFPLRTRNVEEHLAAQPLLAVLLGAMAPVFLACVLFILAVLVVTIPLIPVALIAIFLAYWIGKAAIAAFLGRRLLEAAKVADPQPLASVVVGLFVILILTGPTPAWFAITMFAVVGTLATGAALLSFMRTRPGLLVPPATSYAAPGALAQPFTPPSGPAASGPPAIPQ
jgi:hypothetical protein